jgi:magnesium transporter
MIEEIKGKTDWIKISSPTEEDIEFLKEKFNFHPVILHEIASPSSRTKVENYGEYIYTVYHLPIYNLEKKTSQETEIDFIATKKCIITTQYKEIESVDELFSELKEKDEKNILNGEPEKLFYEILQRSLIFSLRQLFHIGDKIKKIGNSIFKGKEKEMIKEISIVKRDILDQRLIAKPQRTILESLIIKGESFFEKDSRIYFNDLLGDHNKLWNTLDNFKETIEALESTNNTLFNSKTNEIMKLLTIMTFFALPLSLLVNTFSMSNIYTPLTDNPYGFWIVIIAMVFISLGLYTFFKIKKWL